MNSLYLILVVAVVFFIFCVIGYYLYQEAKFKKMVESTFNQKTDDILMSSKKKIVFEGENRNLAIKFDDEIIKKDKVSEDVVKPFEVNIDLANDNEIKNNSKVINNIVTAPAHQEIDKLFSDEDISKDVNIIEALEKKEKVEQNTIDINQELEITNAKESLVIPEDSLEAFFVKFDEIVFPYQNEVSNGIDLIIDIIFEDVNKLRSMIEMSQFTEKKYRFYVLDKTNNWSVYESGKKYVARGIKLVVELVDRDGIMNQAQILNVYNNLHGFAVEKDGHIRVSNYNADIEKIKQDVNQIEYVELDLNLYLVLQNEVSYANLNTFLSKDGFINQNGRFIYSQNSNEVFMLSDENGNAINVEDQHKLLMLTLRMHLQKDPLKSVDLLMDFAERFMEQFESRLLTTNKLVIGEKEYNALINYISEYVKKTDKYTIELGGDLIKRVY
jgi:hypothetical protein